MEVGLGPGNIVLDGDPTPSPSPTAEIRRGKKERKNKKKKEETTGQNIMSASAMQGGHN